MERRDVLIGLGTLGGVAVAGYGAYRLAYMRAKSQYSPLNTPSVVENRPDAVYIPSHIEGMKMIDVLEKNGVSLGLFYSYPHRFWTLTGQNRNKVEINKDDSLHLMASLWDSETKVGIPSSSLSFEILRNGETVVEKPPWPMLSQNMGFHFGDNISLPEEESYTINTDVSPLQIRKTGVFQDRFNEQKSFESKFEYNKEKLNEIMFRTLDEKKGQKGAIDPMNMMNIPIPQLPSKNSFPGNILGSGRSGDGNFISVLLDRPPGGIEKEGSYLVVSAQTPYNNYPLPFMSVSAEIKKRNNTIFDGPLTPTLGSDLNFHYGKTINNIQNIDTLNITFGAPPQIVRHEGYETAFFNMKSIQITS